MKKKKFNAWKDLETLGFGMKKTTTKTNKNAGAVTLTLRLRKLQL